MQRGNMCARRDDYGGDAAKHLKGIQVYASNTFLTIIKDNLIQAQSARGKMQISLYYKTTCYDG